MSTSSQKAAVIKNLHTSDCFRPKNHGCACPLSICISIPLNGCSPTRLCLIRDQSSAHVYLHLIHHSCSYCALHISCTLGFNICLQLLRCLLILQVHTFSPLPYVEFKHNIVLLMTTKQIITIYRWPKGLDLGESIVFS